MQLFDSPHHSTDLQQTVSGAVFVRSVSRSAAPATVSSAREQVCNDFATAKGWAELQGRLLLKGYVLREQGNRLALCRRSDLQNICHASDLGTPYNGLKRRFGVPLPNAAALRQPH